MKKREINQMNGWDWAEGKVKKLGRARVQEGYLDLPADVLRPGILSLTTALLCQFGLRNPFSVQVVWKDVPFEYRSFCESTGAEVERLVCRLCACNCSIISRCRSFPTMASSRLKWMEAMDRHAKYTQDRAYKTCEKAFF